MFDRKPLFGELIDHKLMIGNKILANNKCNLAVAVSLLFRSCRNRNAGGDGAALSLLAAGGTHEESTQTVGSGRSRSGSD